MLESLRLWLSGLFLTLFGFQSVNVQPSITTSPPEYQSPISIKYLRSIELETSKIKIEQKLSNGSNYERYIVSYISEGNKIFGLLTIPLFEKPKEGFPGIIFNHGYIPPKQYSTLGNYNEYVDYLARNGFVVFKIDFRGHGKSEGIPSGSYFSSSYTKDSLAAFKSLQNFEKVNADKIGYWGHSMSGNLVLRSMLINKEIKAGVIWAGAVYSYEDFGKYKISDNTYSPIVTQTASNLTDPNRDTNERISKLRSNYLELDFNDVYWKEVSLSKNISFLDNPVQIHHAKNDNVVNIGYSRDLVKVLQENNKKFEYFEYESGGHNITGDSFNLAMERTVKFFKNYLK